MFQGRKPALDFTHAVLEVTHYKQGEEDAKQGRGTQQNSNNISAKTIRSWNARQRLHGPCAANVILPLTYWHCFDEGEIVNTPQHLFGGPAREHRCSGYLDDLGPKIRAIGRVQIIQPFRPFAAGKCRAGKVVLCA